jgi:hypothetical protein
MPDATGSSPVNATGVDLVLAGHRLRVAVTDVGLRGAAVEVVTPPCEVAAPSGDVGWTLWAGNGPGLPQPDELRGRPVLSFPDGGPQLRVTDAVGGRLRVSGVLHAGEAVAHLTVDRVGRETVLHLPDAEGPENEGTGARWVSWLARVYFGSRLLAEGWRMLHAAAVTVDAGAVLVLAGPWGGKSTLVHRACREHGAALLADDLVFLGEDGTVVGWPTRVALPVSLCSGVEIPRRQRRVVDGQLRDRVLFSPSEYRRAFAVQSAGPTPLAGVVVVGRSNPWQADRLIVEALDTRRLRSALDAASRVAAQKLYLLDLLGVTGNSWHVATGPVASLSTFDLRSVSGVFVRISDTGLLESLPVWDLVQEALARRRWAS